MRRRTTLTCGSIAVAAIAAALACAASARTSHSSRTPPTSAEIAAIERSIAPLVARARDEAWLPGLSAAFALPDGRVGTAVAGFADARAPMTPDTRFLAGSVGKSFHAALAVALARDGIVDLDAPISRWVGREAWFARLPNARELTLRLLLQHRSGLIDHVYSLEFIARELSLRLFEERGALIPAQELIEPALDRKPKFPAGEGFLYGDTNYVLAGIVIEHATRRSPFDQIEQRFLRPLRLAGITPARTPRIPRLAVGHQLLLNPFLLPPRMVDGDGELVVHPMLESTAGGLAATPRDLVRWAKALFEGRSLPADVVAEMTRNPVAAEDGRDYGLGIYRYDTRSGRAWGHGGYFPGYRSALLYFPDAKIAVAVQANRDVGVDVNEIAIEIAQRVRRRLGELTANAR